ncbi:heavy metal translocating P-type ATPase [uncultured Vagococcus sp.]|uniref:heavy metal translocating P-type ATPase n=1 Tax=uncultured Vagococcus sp. TaxID=189676 RepID=UPI0037DD8A3D
MEHKHHNHSAMEHEQTEHQAHDHTGHGAQFKKKFFISLIAAIPIIIIAPMMGKTLPFQFTFYGSEWLVLLLGTFLYFYGGWPFLQGAKSELVQRKPAMMTLISLGISVAYFYSIYAFVVNEFLHSPTHIMDFFWELASLIVIMLLGHWIEMNAVSNAGNALQKMAELLPSEATLIDDQGKTTTIPLDQVRPGQQVIVKSGESIPVDGVITKGATTVNESLITGESKEVSKTIDDQVIGGSTNGSGSIIVEITATGESGYLSQVMNLVNQAQQEKSKAESLSDKVASWLFYVALAIGGLAFIIWLVLTKDLNIALERLVTVLIIACPHALGLAIPLVVARSTSIGAQNGLLVKKRQSLEVARHVDMILMDKTGTLTEGNFAVTLIQSFNFQISDHEILGFMAAIEQYSSHPLATGILSKANQLGLELRTAEEVTTIPGVGLSGKIDQQELKIVSASYLDKQSLTYDHSEFDKLSSQGNSVSYLIINNEVVGLIAQGDQIKAGAKPMIQKLLAEGIQPVMLTGDNRQVAELVAKQLGISNVHAELMPEDKDQLIREYRNQGFTTMMVGDGINDAPSLARADVGVAIGAGTDVAIDSADIILVKSDPADILHLLSLAKNTTRKMTQNLWWGAGYNIVALPLAAGILAPIGILLSPAFGAVLMSVSTVIVAINAILLKID